MSKARPGAEDPAVAEQLEAAAKAFEDGRIEDALARTKKALALSPELPEALHYLLGIDHLFLFMRGKSAANSVTRFRPRAIVMVPGGPPEDFGEV